VNVGVRSGTRKSPRIFIVTVWHSKKIATCVASIFCVTKINDKLDLTLKLRYILRNLVNVSGLLRNIDGLT
jgi:hypothetical protein